MTQAPQPRLSPSATSSTAASRTDNCACPDRSMDCQAVFDTSSSRHSDEGRVSRPEPVEGPSASADALWLTNQAPTPSSSASPYPAGPDSSASRQNDDNACVTISI